MFWLLLLGYITVYLAIGFVFAVIYGEWIEPQLMKIIGGDKADIPLVTWLIWPMAVLMCVIVFGGVAIARSHDAITSRAFDPVMACRVWLRSRVSWTPKP